MILIASFDSAADVDAPRWQRPMPAGAQRWLLKVWALGANDEVHQHTLRLKQPCDYHTLRVQQIEKTVDEIRRACGGIRRMKFWLYKAR